jgi:hypothetical protein
MTEHAKTSAKGWVLFRWLFAAAFIAAVALSGLFTGLMSGAGLFYLIFGTAASVLMGFTGREIAAAFRHAAGGQGDEADIGRSSYLWTAAARNAWILGALGSALNFTIVLSRVSGGLAEVSNGMIRSFIVVLYGLVLAVVCLIPATKLSGRIEGGRRLGTGRSASEAGREEKRVAAGAVAADRIVGYVLFAAVLVVTVVLLIKGQPEAGPLPLIKILVQGPAYLVILGGTIALALFMGSGAGARAWTLGFAMTGIVSLLMGLIQALFGFVHRDITEVSSAIAFIISASMITLLGLVAVASPLEDREVMDVRRAGPGSLSRFFWVLLPLLTFIFLVLTFIMVVTPMKQVAQ